KVKVTENISHSDTKARENDVFISLLTGGNSLVSVYYPDIMDPARAQILNIELGTEQAEINVLIPHHNLRRLEGRIVTGKDKTPLKKVTIQLRRKDDDNASIFSEFGSGQQTSLSDDDGRWSFKDLPKGAYQIVAEPPTVYAETYGETTNTVANTNYAYSNRPATMMGNTQYSAPPQ